MEFIDFSAENTMKIIDKNVFICVNRLGAALLYVYHRKDVVTVKR